MSTLTTGLAGSFSSRRGYAAGGREVDPAE